MNRLAVLLLVCAASAAPYAQADDAAAMNVLRAGCTEDAQRLCANVPPGGGRILQCLKDHKDSLSDKCKQAAQEAMSMSGNPPANSSDASSAAPGSVAAPSSAPTPSLPAPSSTPPKPAAKVSAFSATKPAAVAAAPGSYLRLKKAQVSYAQVAGLPEPQPAIDMLIPTTWNFNGAVRMNTGKGGCICDRFAVFWEAKSQDGTIKFQGIPNYSWKYSDDPQEMHSLNDPMQREKNAANQPCPVARPLNAEQYFRQNVLNDLKPTMTVISTEPLPALDQLVRQRNGLPSSGGGDSGVSVDATRVRLEFQMDGKPMEAWFAVAVVTQATRVGRGFLYDMHAVGQMALAAPKGQLDNNNKLFNVMMASIQPTPAYASFSNQWLAKYYQVHADVLNSITAAYLHMTANAQRVSDQGFRASDQNLRDVQTYLDPSTGRKVELSNQYNHAWLNGANEYVMSDDPNFNPNSQLSGSWNQLQPVPP